MLWISDQKVWDLNTEFSPFSYSIKILMYDASSANVALRSEPVFVNVNEAQKSIPPGWELITGLLKRFTNTGSDEV